MAAATSTKQNGIASGATDVSYINYGEEDQMEMHGFRYDRWRATATWLGVVLSLGALRLVFHWYPKWMLHCTHVSCPLHHATKVLLVEDYLGTYKTYFVKDVQTASTSGRRDSPQGSQAVRVQLSNGTSTDIQNVKAVWIKKLCYIWDEQRSQFVKLAGLDKGITKAQLHQYRGFNEYQQLLRRNVYGPNDIPVQVQSIWKLLLLEIINPFYIFQFFTLVVWGVEQYVYYLCAVVLMTGFGVTSTIIQTRKNQKSLRDTVNCSDTITVCRGNNQYEEVSTTQLVPGDIIVIPPHGCEMHCDAVLLTGTCIVNESMLTGESVPVNKTSIPMLGGEQYDSQEDIKHTLFCGTKVIQTRFYGNERVHAVVLRTGFMTAKGNLVRSILYPSPADFKFDQDTYKFVIILAVIAALGFIYTLVIKVQAGDTPGSIAIKALDLITIAIPPALPAALTVGKLYAQNRLQDLKIYCINSRVINVTGSINCVCFDKTGTLTEDGLDMWGTLPVQDQTFQAAVKDMTMLGGAPLELGMAACHSLTLINGDLCGDPLDIKMFESTGWTLEEPEVADQAKYDLMIPTVVKSPHAHIEMGLVHQFQFSSTLQRMSVVIRTLGSQDFVLYCKGSPEMIVSLSDPATVPEDLSDVLQQYTEQGFRVIAVGRRTLHNKSYTKITRIKREEVERDLEFLGMIVLENRLKPETIPALDLLRQAHIKVAMITGDNILTAISVAKKCGIVQPGETVVNVTAVPKTKDSPAMVFYTSQGALPTANGGCGDIEAGVRHNRYKLALTGRTWAVLRENFPELVPRVCTGGAVFARMSSNQKQQLVEELKGLDYYVAMCGDGANDCGALKAAHAGISLSEAEASVASPFTSKEANIKCVPKVVQEGRAALSTSAGIFKFMVAYALVEFTSCIILYAADSNLTDLQFLFIDICLVVNFAFFFGRTQAYRGPMVKDPPLTSLLSFLPLMSLVVFMVITIAVQATAFHTVQQFSWYPDYNKTRGEYPCYENYAVFTVSMFQYIALVVTYSQGKPYRRAIYTNRALIISLVVTTLVCVYLTVYPPSFILTAFDYIQPPAYDFKVIVLCLAVIHFILVVFGESVVVDYLLAKVTFLTHRQTKYMSVEQQVVEDEWPTLSKEIPTHLQSSAIELSLSKLQVMSVSESTNHNHSSAEHRV